MVPSNSDSISSGFPFHPQLYNLQVTHDEWHQFTSEIINAAKLSASEDAEHGWQESPQELQALHSSSFLVLQLAITLEKPYIKGPL
jgi:hypothetical protein